MAKKTTIIHPGEILREEFLVPMEISQYRLAKETGLPESRVSDLCLERRAITADTALRLARFFGTSAEFWMNLQSHYDLREAERKLGATIRTIRRVVAKHHDVSPTEHVGRTPAKRPRISKAPHARKRV